MASEASGHVRGRLPCRGRVIAEATGTEDGCPTTGAASGTAIAVAAVIAGLDPARIEMLPDAGGRPHEVPLLKGHSVNFGESVRQMIALGGGRAREVVSVNKVSGAHLGASVTERTAALLFVQSHHTVHKGQIPLAEVVAQLALPRGAPRDRPGPGSPDAGLTLRAAARAPAGRSLEPAAGLGRQVS
ncbi:hypothetical protein ACFW5S_21725 [Streptomyces olivaceus]|uniref:hypothetical protein n=1 Tax=Streptomyces olivaceus TaxID=47716 RepID=UPI0036D122CD